MAEWHGDFGAAAEDPEIVATDMWELAATAARVWTAAHVLTAPVLVLVVRTGPAIDDDQR